MSEASAECHSTVLVVEDDADVRQSLCEVLEDNGYVPVAAANGRDGLDCLRSAPAKPCLVLLDIMMPVMDGWGFRTAQLEDPEFGDVPVVVLSAHASAESAARKMKASSFLRKPIDIDTLLAAVQRFCD